MMRCLRGKRVVASHCVLNHVPFSGPPKGKGQVITELKRNDHHTVTAKVGERTGSATIGKTISTTGVLDIIGTCIFIIPVIGIFQAGFYDLEPTTVSVAVPAK